MESDDDSHNERLADSQNDRGMEFKSDIKTAFKLGNDLTLVEALDLTDKKPSKAREQRDQEHEEVKPETKTLGTRQSLRQAESLYVVNKENIKGVRENSHV